MIRCQLRKGEHGAVPLIRCECVRVRLTRDLKRCAHRDARDVCEFLNIGECVWDRDVVRPFVDADELHDLVQSALLMLLRLRVHIRRADGDDGRASVANFLSILVELLAEGFGEELDVPLGDGFQIVAVRHHDLDVAPVLLRGGELERGVEHRRVLPEVVILTRGIHIARTREELLDVKSDARGERQPDLGKDGEPPADAVRHGELLPPHLHRELLEERRLLLIRVGDGDDLDLDVVRLHKFIVHDHEVRHRVECAARLRDDEQHDAECPRAVLFLDLCDVLEVIDNITRAPRVDVVPAEIDARVVPTLFVRE